MTAEIRHGDCLELLAEISSSSVDAVIMDPPYCSGAVSESARTAAKGQGRLRENVERFGWFVGDNMTTAGLAWLLRSVAVESHRILKPSGSLLCFMDWRMAPTLIPALESSGLRYQNLVVWDKGSAGLGVGFRATHELVAHLTAGKPEYFSRSLGNVIRCPRAGADRLHPTQKPSKLLRALIQVVTPPGGLVVDPFSGSGSVAHVASGNGYRAIGIERDQAYVEISRDRLANDAPLLTADGEETCPE